MRQRNQIHPASALTAVLTLFVAAVICLATATAYCQVAPSGTARSDEETAPDQAQTPNSSNLNSLNENAGSLQYTDGALNRKPFFFGVETSGTWTSNLFNSLDDQSPQSGSYVDVAIPIGIHLSSQTTNFGANFREDSAFYPGNSDLNHNSYTYSHQLDHQLSDTTKTSWSLAGGHIVNLGNYLSPVIGVGSGGVAFSPRPGGLVPLNDAATSYSITHQLSERDSIIASGTAGWLDQPVSGQPVVADQYSTYERATGGGNVQWQRALNARQIVGVDLTDVYIKSFAPAASSNFTAATVTFSQTLTPHSVITGGIGPLIVNSNQSELPSVSTFSYAANAGIEYQTIYAHISGGYSRLYQSGYFASTNIANQFYFRFNRPLSRRFNLTFDSEYMKVTTPTQTTYGEDYSQFGFTGRLDTRITSSLVYYVSGSTFTQGSVTTGIESPGYRYNAVTTGFTCYFGNPFSRPSGVQ